MKKDFKNWHSIKEKINYEKINFRFRERDIFFMYLGANVGFEQDGGKEFSRPVLVYKKFNKYVFLGFPLTSQTKNDKFHYSFEYKENTKSYAILSQIKLYDIRRARFRDGMISNDEFFNLQEKFLNLVVTPLEKPKGAHKSDL